LGQRSLHGLLDFLDVVDDLLADHIVDEVAPLVLGSVFSSYAGAAAGWAPFPLPASPIVQLVRQSDDGLEDLITLPPAN